MFLTVYLPLERVSVPLGVLFAVLCPAAWMIVRKRQWRRTRLAAALCCAGLACGFLWTAAYMAVFFQPAKELDDRTVILIARVADWPQEGSYGYSVLVQVETDSFVTLNAIVYTDEQGAQLRPGDQISTIAHCVLGDRTFSGQEITYYVAKGIFLRAKAYGSLEIQRPDHVPVSLWPVLLSKALKTCIDAAFPSDAAALVKALVTGNRDNLTDQYTTSLQRTGLSHTVAISGMHLAFLATMVSALLGRGRRRTALATIFFVLLFCGVVGNTPSVLRAAVMIILLHIAPLVRRERDGATALGTALFLQLVQNPFAAAHVGLQLSFGAVTGIFLISDKICDYLDEKLGLNRYVKHWLHRKLLRIPGFLTSTLSATLGASVLTIPLVAIHFQMFSLISPVANLLTLWAISLLFMGGLWVSVLGLFWPDIAALTAVPFTWLARYLEFVVTWLAKLPLASISLNSFYYRAWMVYLCVLLGLTLGLRGKKRLILTGCMGAVTLALSLYMNVWSFQSGDMAAVILDVGQGQSVLIRSGRFLMLADCGGSGVDDAGDVAADYVQSLGRSKLDLLVLSHYHSDHANGIRQLLQRLDVRVLAVPDVEEDSSLRQEILSLAEEQGISIWFIREDTQVKLGAEQTITLYAPLGSGDSTNELGLSVLATYGDTDILLTGDMGEEVEPLLLAHAQLPDIELLVVGHHGSSTSTTQELLDVVKPDLAAISVGENNSYGHPAQDTLERLAQSGADIYRTDLHGTIQVQFYSDNRD